MKKLKDVKKIYDFFPRIYERVVKKYVPFYQVKEKGKKRFKGKCN